MYPAFHEELRKYANIVKDGGAGAVMPLPGTMHRDIILRGNA
jgi:hypothetical protein